MDDHIKRDKNFKSDSYDVSHLISNKPSPANLNVFRVCFGVVLSKQSFSVAASKYRSSSCLHVATGFCFVAFIVSVVSAPSSAHFEDF